MAEVSFGEWLRRRRKAGGWTQEQLAQQLSCSTIMVRKIEAEERRPSEQVVERLAELFQIPPNEETAFLRFARGDWKSAPVEAVEDVPWRLSTISPRSNLPVPLTALIGREHEISDLHQYISNPDIRLITLIGPPGIGKTRLSIDVAREIVSQFTNGVFFVALAHLEDQNLVVSTISQTLGFIEIQNKSPFESLREGIGDKQKFVILDNIEHLIEGTATLVSNLLLACPHLKILTTSREALRVPGEWLYPVPPLDVPKEGVSIAIETASHFAALRLFFERARAVQPTFALNAENIQTVTSICTQLDGLPLAIELVAAHIRLMSPESLLSHLNDQFALYTDGMRAVSARQKTLYNAIGWSYELLPANEQILFRRLAVFAGGWTLEEAQEVCSGEGLKENEVPSLLVHLVDKSLVIVREQKGGIRYQMLETIRQYGKAKLMEFHEAEQVRNRHLEFFMKLAEQAELKLDSGGQASWLNRLEIEQGNIRAALQWGLGSRAEAGIRLASALWLFWFMRAHFTEGRQWYDQALAFDKEASPFIRIRLLIGAGSNSLGRGDFEQTARLAEQSLALSYEDENEWGIAMSLYHLGATAMVQGDYRRAKDLFEKGLVLARETGNWAVANYLLGGLSNLAIMQKNYEQANSLLKDALALSMKQDDRWAISYLLQQLAYIANMQGDYARANALYQQAITLADEFGDRRLVSGLLLLIGMVALDQGRLKRAARLIKAAEALAGDIGIDFDPDSRVDFDRSVAIMLAQLGEATFEALANEGRAMSMKKAITYALEIQSGSLS